MRPLLSARLLGVYLASSLGMALGVACVGPHSTGALWAQQNLDQERTMFQLSDAQRAGITQAFELSLADQSLQAEQARITAELQNCPGPRQPLAISQGDRVRDAIRVQSQADATRLARVAQLAEADWYVRRASATGNAQLCARAQSALSGPPGEAAPADLLDRVLDASVSRDQANPNDSTSGPMPALTTDPPLVTLSAYALGAIDDVYAHAPLPQYLAAVYGGFVSSQPVLGEEAAAALVDTQAPAYPDWEPDALYAALRGGQA